MGIYETPTKQLSEALLSRKSQLIGHFLGWPRSSCSFGGFGSMAAWKHGSMAAAEQRQSNNREERAKKRSTGKGRKTMVKAQKLWATAQLLIKLRPYERFSAPIKIKKKIGSSDLLPIFFCIHFYYFYFFT